MDFLVTKKKTINRIRLVNWLLANAIYDEPSTVRFFKDGNFYEFTCRKLPKENNELSK